MDFVCTLTVTDVQTGGAVDIYDGTYEQTFTWIAVLSIGVAPIALVTRYVCICPLEEYVEYVFNRSMRSDCDLASTL